MLLQVLGGRFLPHQIPGLKNYCKFWGNIFTPSYSGFKKLLQVLGGIFLPPSYSRFKFQIQKAIASFRGNFCKFWGARKIKAFRPIASFGGEFSPHQIPDLKSYCKFWGESFSLMKSKQLSYCKIWGTFKINGSEAIASFGGEFSPHQILGLKSYCKFWGKVFRS